MSSMSAVKRGVNAVPFAKWDNVLLARSNVESAPIHFATYGVGAVDLVPDVPPPVCFATVSFDRCHMNFIRDRLFYDLDQRTFLDVSWTKITHTLVE